MANRFFGYFCNLPLGVPMSVSFKKYHLEHHRYQGDEVIDTDLPTLLEAKLFCTTFGKFCWVCLQPFFYLVRPLIVNPKPPNQHEIINAIIQIVFDAIIVYCFGWRMVAYLIAGTLMAMGLHPVAGSFCCCQLRDSFAHSYHICSQAISSPSTTCLLKALRLIPTTDHWTLSPGT